jgi:hypothetical protein
MKEVIGSGVAQAWLGDVTDENGHFKPICLWRQGAWQTYSPALRFRVVFNL